MESSSYIWLHHFKNGATRYSDKNYPAAIEAFNKSIALNKHWETYQGLGSALFRTNNFPGAIDAFNKSIALNEHWETYQGLGYALFYTNNYPAAIDAFNKSIALNEHWNTYHGLGSALFQTNNFPGAIDAFNKSIALNEHWNTYQGLGYALFYTNNYPAAIDAFNKSIALNEHWNTYQGLGYALFAKHNNIPAAIDAFNKSIALNEHWETYQGLGYALFAKHNNIPAAIDAFNKSIALNEHWNTYHGLGSALFYTNNYPAAIDAFNKSIALNEHWETYQGLGYALFQTNNFPGAIDAFNKSIALNEHWNTYQGLGYALFHTKKHLKAIHATVNAYIINSSNIIEKQFYEICLQANNENDIDNTFMYFAESGNPDKKQWAETHLKKYILNNIKTSKIDVLLLRQASLLIRDKNEKSVLPREDENLLDKLIESSMPKERDLTEISTFHRYVFGVSHSALHRASSNTTVILCGAGTMFSIGDPTSITKHFQTINHSLKTIHPKNSVLVFEFGEVDIRNHIFKVARNNAQSILSIANNSIFRYISFLKSLKVKGYNIMISGPHCGGGEYDVRGSAVERNDLCAYINDALNLESRAHGFYFFTLFDKVVNQKTLKEIPGLYSDKIHLCLPPSKIGIALNDLLNKRVDGAFSPVRSPYRLLQQEEVHAECTLVVSDIPNWQTGTAFNPGKEVPSNEEHFEVDKYMLLIELPFLMHPKEVTLEFKQPALNIKTAIQGVLESWDISKETQAGNIIHAYSVNNNGISKDTSISHSFTSQNAEAEMCRFLLVRISSNAIGNHLTMINIKRWTHQFQQKRLQTIS